jgi:hypothetical protein
MTDKQTATLRAFEEKVRAENPLSGSREAEARHEVLADGWIKLMVWDRERNREAVPFTRWLDLGGVAHDREAYIFAGRAAAMPDDVRDIMHKATAAAVAHWLSIQRAECAPIDEDHVWEQYVEHVEEEITIAIESAFLMPIDTPTRPHHVQSFDDYYSDRSEAYWLARQEIG